MGVYQLNHNSTIVAGPTTCMYYVPVHTCTCSLDVIPVCTVHLNASQTLSSRQTRMPINENEACLIMQTSGALISTIKRRCTQYYKQGAYLYGRIPSWLCEALINEILKYLG